MATFASDSTTSTGFDHIKAVQIVAYFVDRCGGKVEKMKLIKLIYLADRLSFARRSRPMNFDDFFSMQHGPVASSALDGINGKGPSPAWKAVELSGFMVTVAADVGTDHLSRNDLAILDETWTDFGGKSASQLRAWTHKNCAEYKDVDQGRLSITYEEILDALGIDQADDIAKELKLLQREMGRLPVANAA